MEEYKLPYNKVMYGWYMPHDLCDDLVDYFEDSTNKRKGMVGDGLDESVKKSTDVSLDF